MTICPIALIAGCPKCPAFKICPLKGALGSKPPAPPPPPARPQARAKTAAKPRAAGGKKRR
jgi:hypothetical protein